MRLAEQSGNVFLGKRRKVMHFESTLHLWHVQKMRDIIVALTSSSPTAPSLSPFPLLLSWCSVDVNFSRSLSYWGCKYDKLLLIWYGWSWGVLHENIDVTGMSCKALLHCLSVSSW